MFNGSDDLLLASSSIQHASEWPKNGKSNIAQKQNFFSKIEILQKVIFCRNVGRKLVVLFSKIEILIKNRNVGRKLVVLFSKIEILIKNRNFGRKLVFFSQKSKF